jgi:hypothetical protein
MPKNIYTFHYTYLITNTNTQMKYIGVRSCTCLPENDGYMGSSKILGEALNKNPEYFTKTIIDTFPTREIANTNEQWFHETYDVARNSEFYNLCIAPKKFNMCGRTLSDATRKKQSIVKMGSNNPFYGKTHTVETIEKMIISRSGKSPSIETRKKQSIVKMGPKNHNYGKPKSAEIKKKLSISLMGRKFSEETRKKMSDAQKGIPKAKITCPHCSKLGGISPMKRWHFNNCREIA